MNRLATAQHITQQCLALCKLASRAKFDLLRHVLEMAAIEAANVELALFQKQGGRRKITEPPPPERPSRSRRIRKAA